MIGPKGSCTYQASRVIDCCSVAVLRTEEAGFTDFRLADKADILSAGVDVVSAMNGHSLETVDVRPYMSLAGVAQPSGSLTRSSEGEREWRRQIKKNEEENHG